MPYTNRQRSSDPTSEDSLVLPNIPLFDLIIPLIKLINRLFRLSPHRVPRGPVSLITSLDLFRLLGAPRLDGFRVFVRGREGVGECRCGEDAGAGG